MFKQVFYKNYVVMETNNFIHTNTIIMKTNQIEIDCRKSNVIASPSFILYEIITFF